MGEHPLAYLLLVDEALVRGLHNLRTASVQVPCSLAAGRLHSLLGVLVHSLQVQVEWVGLLL